MYWHSMWYNKFCYTSFFKFDLILNNVYSNFFNYFLSLNFFFVTKAFYKNLKSARADRQPKLLTRVDLTKLTTFRKSLDSAATLASTGRIHALHFNHWYIVLIFIYYPQVRLAKKKRRKSLKIFNKYLWKLFFCKGEQHTFNQNTKLLETSF